MQKLQKYEKLTGLLAATYFKYFSLNNNSYIVNKLPLHRISAKTLYLKNKDIFDKLVEVFYTCNIDVVKYLNFFTMRFGKSERDIPKFLLNMFTINKFVEYLQIKRQYYNIYKYFMKSVNNIVDDCIKYNYTSTKEYLRYLIVNNLLVNEYITGRISCYYLCAILNFKKIIPKMNNISRNEFSKILLRYDKYNNDVQEAFKLYKSTRVSPLQFTDELLWKKINNK